MDYSKVKFVKPSVHKFKKGDYVYYRRVTGECFNTIPCEVVKVNKKTVVLDDGTEIYRNIRFSSIELQTCQV